MTAVGLRRHQDPGSGTGCGSMWQVTIKESLYEGSVLRHPISTMASFSHLKRSQAVLIKTSWEMNYGGESIKKFNLEMEQTIVRISY